MHPAVERALREAAVRTSNHVLAANELGQPDDPLRNEFRMLDHVGSVTDYAGNEQPALRQFHILPKLPLMLVTRIRAFEDIRSDLNAQDKIDNILERHVGRVRSRPASPAHMITDALR